MIPAGYVDSLVAWATRPDLTDAVKTQRRKTLLDEHDRLIGGQLNGKASRTLTSGGLNGKSFDWVPDVTAAEKASVLLAVLGRLGLLSTDAKRPTVTFASFGCLQR